MPGIVGLITRMPRERAEDELRRMVRAIRHEPFYSTGTWMDETLGAYAGWTARENSFSDGGPLRNAAGDVTLVFSGEEFPEPETISRLQSNGHALAGKGPRYLIRMYEEDKAFPAGLNGRFHGLLADRGRGTAALFNDRYGMHRVYYYETKDAFYFAAEAKAILAVRPELRTIDPQGLGELVSCGCVLANRSVFKGLRVLPGGAAWAFRNGEIERRNAYFDPREWEAQPALAPESYYPELRRVFSLNLPRYFAGEERIGMSLTGGLDTRLIMAWHKAPAGALPCYTFGGTYRDSRDVRIARRVAQNCGQSHDVIRAGKEFLASFARYAERTIYLTDGCADVSQSPVLYGTERARRIAPVRMSGNYGDEVLRRQRVFRPLDPAPGVFRPEFLTCVEEARRTYGDLVQAHPLSFAVFRQAPWHHYGLLSLEQTQVSMRTPYLDNDVVRTVFRAPDSACADNGLRERLIGDGDVSLGRIRTDLGFGGTPGSGIGAASRRLHRFTFRAEYAYDYGMPQWVARIDSVLSPLHLERLFLGRHKYYHFRVWYRDALSRYVREMLLDPRTLSRPYLERSGVETIVKGHLKGDRNYTTAIHKVLTLELLHRLFIDAA